MLPAAPFMNWGQDVYDSIWTGSTAQPRTVYSDRTYRSLLSDIGHTLNWENVEYRTQQDSVARVKTLVLDLKGTFIHTLSFSPHFSVQFVKSSTGL
jgi:hypothetical protein